MKRFIIFVMLFLVTVFAEQIVLTNYVNLRDSASPKGKQIGIVNPGTFDVLESVSVWSKVSVDGKEGYIGSKCLADGVVLTPGAVLRKTGSSTGEKICLLKTGTKVTIISEQKIWFKIKFVDKEGWIYKAK